MANSLSVAGNTSVSWSLSDDAGNSKSDSQRSTRSITTGTGPNQANVAWSETWTTTGSGSASWPAAALPVSSFGVSSAAAGVSVMKELLVSVTTGPSGGYVTFGAPTGVTGVRINVGGQFHLADYLTGITLSTGDFAIANGVTGTYSGDITVVGNGVFESL